MPRWPSLRRQTGCLQIIRRPLSPRVVPTFVRRERVLLLLHQREHRAQPLVLNDRSGFHGLDFVEQPERQWCAFELNREPAVRVSGAARDEEDAGSVAAVSGET